MTARRRVVRRKGQFPQLSNLPNREGDAAIILPFVLQHGAPTSTPFAGRSAATTRAARLGQSARHARSPRRGGGGHDHYHRETQCPSGDEPNGH